MRGSIEERLKRERQSNLVGRDQEQELFRSAISGERAPFALLWVFGPGGVGKTSLLNAFEDLCSPSEVAVTRIDCRSIRPTPDAFLDALCTALGAGTPAEMWKILGQGERQYVILIDTFEDAEPLQEWVGASLIPKLSTSARVVIASRLPPPAAWRADSGLHSLLRPLSLRNLSPDESRSYLHRRQIPDRLHDKVLGFTHGHPLALTLVADVFDSRGDIGPDLESAPDVIHALLERFIRKAPGPQHRLALEACAVVRQLNEPLLARLLGQAADSDSVRELFDWLRGLSFMETGRRGLFPHDLAREALLADLRWRNSDRYGDLHRRARDYYRKRWAETHGGEQQRILFDFMFLHRDSAIVRTAFAWSDAGHLTADSLRDGDLNVLESMTRRHEGEDSVRLLKCWASREPESFLVMRETGEAGSGGAARTLAGYALLLALEKTTGTDRVADPAIQNAWRFLEDNAPLRPGESAAYLRFWMAEADYQAVSAVQSLLLVNMLRRWLSVPNLAYTFFPCADPDLWEPLLGYAEMKRLTDADFTLNGRRYGVFGNDWRVLSPAAWLDLMAEKETAEGAAVTAARPEELVVLSETEFASALREALRCFTEPDQLQNNLLLRSRVVVRRTGPAPLPERIEALQALIRESAESLKSTARCGRAYGPLHHTYIEPLATQEAVADGLDLPFSTYRRHLSEGIASITASLWRQEIDAWAR